MTASIRVTYDATVDAAYIYLRKPRLWDRLGPTLLCERDPETPTWVNVDVDAFTGRIAGIEVLGAWAALPAELLADAERIDGRHAATRCAERLGWMAGSTGPGGCASHRSRPRGARRDIRRRCRSRAAMLVRRTPG